MKLADWAAKQGISYLTAYRWFKRGTLPVEAYQSDSGTIIVKDEFDTEITMAEKQPNDALSLFFKKTIEFSKNQSTVEEFATYIFSTFSLRLLSQPSESSPKYSRQKPKSEEVQKHFQKFIPKGEKPKPNMFVAKPEELETLVAKANELEAQELVNQIHINDEGVPAISHAGVEVPAAVEMKDLLQELSTAVSSVGIGSVDNLVSLNSNISLTGVENVEQTSALSPHSLNYTSSNYVSSPVRDLKFDEPIGTSNYLLRSNTSSYLGSFSESNDDSVFSKKLTSSLINKPKRGRPRKK